MKKTLNSKKGITLIALVITIIVLIILAGISIAVLTGEDGLITKAKQGAQNYQNAAIEEQQALNSIYDGVGAQLSVGSTNNNGTPTNQGGTSVTANGGNFTQDDRNKLDALYSAMSGGTVVGINELADLLPNSLSISGDSSAGSNNDNTRTSGACTVPTLGIYKKLTAYGYGRTTDGVSGYTDVEVTTYKKVNGEIVASTQTMRPNDMDISDCVYVKIEVPSLKRGRSGGGYSATFSK